MNKESAVELVCRILCWNRVGDPDKLDSSGSPNWKWYRSEAERFVSIQRDKMEELLIASIQK